MDSEGYNRAIPGLPDQEVFVTKAVPTRLIAALATGFLIGVAAEAAATPDRPNILFIYTDDHSYRTVGAYPQAYPWVRTPNFDRLAQRGVRFEYAYIGTLSLPHS